MLPGEAGGIAAPSELDRQTWRSVATMGAEKEIRAVVEQACQPVRQSGVDERHDGLAEGRNAAMGRQGGPPRRLRWTDRPGGLSPRWGSHEEVRDPVVCARPPPR
jgi:hypothetical protein